jgi:precorrin-3B methylase
MVSHGSQGYKTSYLEKGQTLQKTKEIMRSQALKEIQRIKKASTEGNKTGILEVH